MIKLEVSEEEFSLIYQAIRGWTISLDDEQLGLAARIADPTGSTPPPTPVDAEMVKEIQDSRVRLEALIDKLFNQKQGI